MKKIHGKAASFGIAIAKSYLIEDNTLNIEKYSIDNINNEFDKLDKSLKIAEKQILSLKKKAEEKFGKDEASIFDAHLTILFDPELISQTKNYIKENKINVAFALQEIAENFKTIFLSMNDEYMKERAADIADVTTRVIKIIEGIDIKDLSLINEPVIIIAKDLTPSETSQLNAKYVKGFITKIGGRTSHSAIMARSMEIPAIVGVGEALNEINPNEEILLDGSRGLIFVNPLEETKKDYIQEIKKEEEIKKLESEFIKKPSQSKDGVKTKIAANIGSIEDIKGITKFGAEGIGLFRTEFLYMYSKNWPTEEEQFLTYKKVLESEKKHKVVIRTLDIGGDKKLEYFKFPKEENPFLGYRAIRFQLDNTKVMVEQFRALLRASKYGKLAINIPMVATINEFLKVKEKFKQIEKILKKEGHKIGKYELGIMVEIPSVVEMIDKFSKYVDFFSIGTNDLIQYTFAVDRMSQHVSYLYQPFNPTILRMIYKTINASHHAEKWTAICGEMGSEPLLAPVFLGMGLDEYSMSANAIPKIRRIISMITKKEASELVKVLLEKETELEVLKELKLFFKQKRIDYN